MCTVMNTNFLLTTLLQTPEEEDTLCAHSFKLIYRSTGKKQNRKQTKTGFANIRFEEVVLKIKAHIHLLVRFIESPQLV